MKPNKDQADPIIAYGDAKFSSKAKYENPAPTGSLLKRCDKKFKVKMVDEFRTTLICNRCINSTAKLAEVMDNTTRDQRFAMEWIHRVSQKSIYL